MAKKGARGGSAFSKSVKRAAAKAPPRKRPRLSDEELDARATAARRAAAIRAAAGGVEAWLRAGEMIGEYLQAAAGGTVTMRAVDAPLAAKGTPWRIVIRWQPDRELGPWDYLDLWRALSGVEEDLEIERRIKPTRITRLAVSYRGARKLYDKRRGKKPREYTLGELGPWQVVISRAVALLNPQIEDSITSRYGSVQNETIPTEVLALYLWISTKTAGAGFGVDVA